MDDCVFCKIVKKEVEKEFLYEDEDIVVFPDINPVRPVHLLVMPKKHIKEFIDMTDAELFAKLMNTATKMIKEKKLDTAGYRLIINGGGGQLVDHFHIHIMGPIKQGVI